MKKVYILLIAALFTSTITADAQLDTLRLYTYLHSLMDHRPPLIPTPNDETTVPFWLKLLADKTSDHYESTGEFGTLSQWANNLPPGSELGYDTIPAFWDAEITPFSEADFNNAVIMPLNYQQDLPPRDPYWGDTESPIDFTTTIFEHLITEEPGIQMYIYEHWPDMAAFLSNGFPPSQTEWDNYNDYLNNDYHDWFLEYNDSLVLNFPDDCVSMIPVGPAISTLLNTTPYDTIPIDSLYEDDAPHGRPTIYFLAALTTYMGIHEVQAPSSYTVPDIIHVTIRDNYQDVVNILWSELQNFDDDNGDGRVFCSELVLPVEYVNFSGRQVENFIELQFTTASEINNYGFYVQRSQDGIAWSDLDFIPGRVNHSEMHNYRLIDNSPLTGRNMYRIKQVDLDHNYDYSKVLSIDFDHDLAQIFYPNPVSETLFSHNQIMGEVQIINQYGIEVKSYRNPGNQLSIRGLSDGIYTVRWKRNNITRNHRIIIQN